MLSCLYHLLSNNFYRLNSFYGVSCCAILGTQAQTCISMQGRCSVRIYVFLTYTGKQFAHQAVSRSPVSVCKHLVILMTGIRELVLFHTPSENFAEHWFEPLAWPEFECAIILPLRYPDTFAFLICFKYIYMYIHSSPVKLNTLGTFPKYRISIYTYK